MTVKKVEVADATEPLASYLEKGDTGPIVIIDAGRPVAALVLLENTDLETVALSTDPEFLDLIRASRARQADEGGLSAAEVRRRLQGDPSRKSR
jgi:antitoxin (DNA-binding transcriptional repressor) of toxin-antitoxin stability system